MRDISKNIRQARLCCGMSQDALAEKLHVTRQTVSNYETGRSRPDVDMLVSIATVLGLTVNELIYGLPETPDRRKQKWRLIALCVLCLALCTGVFMTTPLYEHIRWKNIYIPFGLVLPIRYFGYPGAWLLLGFTLMSLAGWFLSTRQIKATWGRYLRLGLILLLAFYFITTLPYALDYSLKVLSDIWPWLEPAERAVLRLLNSKTWPFYITVKYYRFLADYSFVFLLPGALLWIFPGKKGK